MVLNAESASPENETPAGASLLAKIVNVNAKPIESFWGKPLRDLFESFPPGN